MNIVNTFLVAADRVSANGRETLVELTNPKKLIQLVIIVSTCEFLCG